MEDRKRSLLQEFIAGEQASGLVLMAATLAALVIANSSLGPAYAAFWQQKIGFAAELRLSVEHWVNDGLMAIFFLLIGLEIERELYDGELSSIKGASLPAFAAIGGMALPALLHALLNWGTPTQAGIGIPMATDIAFALGVLALLGNRVPPALKVFLTAFAIIDDLGAIVLIALFYVQEFSLPYFASALAIFLGLLMQNRLGATRLSLYLLPGAVMWYCLLRSGVHATLAGVLLAFAIPFGRGGQDSPSHALFHALHKPVTFLIMPIFALANTGIRLDSHWLPVLATANSAGIFLGLAAGKPLGILLFSFLAVRLKISRLPDGVRWEHILGVGLLGGIGFTMSIFISLLAFQEPAVVLGTKVTVLLSSLGAGAAGYLFLHRQGART